MISRRDFLKILGITGAVATFPKVKLTEPPLTLPAGAEIVEMRYIPHYDSYVMGWKAWWNGDWCGEAIAFSSKEAEEDMRNKLIKHANECYQHWFGDGNDKQTV